MRKNESSSYEGPAFKALLRKYEGMVESHTPCYFDTCELFQVEEYYVTRSQLTDALDVMKYCHSLHPDDDIIQIRLTELLIATNKINEAQQLIEDLSESLNEIEQNILHAKIALKSFYRPEVTRLLNKLHSLVTKGDLNHHRDLIDLAIDSGNKELAEAWYNDLKETYDLDFKANEDDSMCKILTKYYFYQTDYAQAAHTLEIYLENNPMDQKSWIRLAKAYHFNKEEEKSFEALEYALAIDDTQYDPLRIKAMLLEKMGKTDEAIRLHKKLAEKFEKDSTYHSDKVMQLEQQKTEKENNEVEDNLEELEEEGQILFGSQYNNMTEMIRLTNMALEQKDLPKAKHYYELAKNSFSSSPRQITLLGNLCLKMDELDEGLSFYDMVLDWPTEDQAYPSEEEEDYLLSMMAMNLLTYGHYNEAFNFYTRLYMRNPQLTPLCCVQMLHALYGAGRKEELLSWYNEFSKTIPNLIKMLELLPEEVWKPMEESIKQAKELFDETPQEVNE